MATVLKPERAFRTLLSEEQALAGRKARPQQASKEDFGEAARAMAAAMLFASLDDKTKAAFEAGQDVKLHPGKRGHPGVTQAYAAYLQAAKSQYGEGSHEASIPRDKFLHMAKYWLPKWMGSRRDCRNKRAKRQKPLTDEEEREAARILARPQRTSEGYHCWRSVQECLDQDTAEGKRLKELFERVNVTPVTWGQQLVHRHPALLMYGLVDKVPKLPAATLRARRKAADVWGRAVPWKIRKGMEDLRDGGAVQSRHYWDWRWYEDFTFMIDATTFDDQEGAAHYREKGFSHPTVKYPPESVRADKPINNISKVMVYAVIHAHLGLIVGPDVMYTGSAATAPSKKGERHEDSFPHWCGLPLLMLSARQCSVSA